MSYRNHRVLATKFKDEVYFQVHEVYYTDDDIPDGYTADPITIGAESLKGMTWQVNRIKECLKKSILWAGDKFPEEYKEDE